MTVQEAYTIYKTGLANGTLTLDQVIEDADDPISRAAAEKILKENSGNVDAAVRTLIGKGYSADDINKQLNTLGKKSDTSKTLLVAGAGLLAVFLMTR